MQNRIYSKKFSRVAITVSENFHFRTSKCSPPPFTFRERRMNDVHRGDGTTATLSATTTKIVNAERDGGGYDDSRTTTKEGYDDPLALRATTSYGDALNDDECLRLP